jgi:glycosyltransferase involved in cell wall biosynthesis
MKHFISKTFIIFSLLLLSSPSIQAKAPAFPIEFVVVIPSYNNEKWCIQNLESVVSQAYPNFTIYYINDCSTDKTGQLVNEFVRSRKLESKCTVVHNSSRKGALNNLYDAISKVAPHKIIVTVDGDDTLAHPYVLLTVANEYAKNDAWLTYGNWRSDPIGYKSPCEEIPSAVAKNNSFRSHKWVTSQLRTFYAKLFHLIKKEDLLYEGKFFPVTWDLAMMFPMLEMASKKHVRFISQILYTYNIKNPLNDFKTNHDLQVKLENYVRNRPAYAPLWRLF